VHPDAALFGFDQAGLLEQAEVLRDRRLSHLEPGGDCVDALGVLLEKAQDLEPALGGERFEDFDLLSFFHLSSFGTGVSSDWQLSIYLYNNILI